MRFGILGPLQVADDGGRELTVGGSKPRALVAILLVHAGEAVSSDRLVEDLWSGEPPASAAKALQVHVSRLRAALANGPGGKDRLQTTAGGYLLRVESGELDAERFERRLEEGGALIAAGNPEQAVATFSSALELWRSGSSLRRSFGSCTGRSWRRMAHSCIHWRRGPRRARRLTSLSTRRASLRMSRAQGVWVWKRRQ